MASKYNELVLFDLCSKPPNHCWSPSTWKVRLILNYKGISYRTEWIEYADVEATLKPLNLPPNPSGRPGRAAYTVPTVIFPDGKAIMDSAAIANELERCYPTPSVSGIPSHSANMPMPGSPEASSNPALAQTAEYAVLHANLGKPIRALMPMGVIDNVVTDYSRPKKLKELGGLSLEEFKTGIDTAQVLKDMEQPLREMSAFWERQGEGFRFDGKLTWAAVQQLSSLQYIRVVAPDIFQHIRRAESGAGVRKLYDSAKEMGWLDRDDF